MNLTVGAHRFALGSRKMRANPFGVVRLRAGRGPEGRRLAHTGQESDGMKTWGILMQPSAYEDSAKEKLTCALSNLET